MPHNLSDEAPLQMNLLDATLTTLDENRDTEYETLVYKTHGQPATWSFLVLQVSAYEDLFDRLVVDKVSLHMGVQTSLTAVTMCQEKTQRYSLKGIARVLKSTQGEAM